MRSEKASIFGKIRPVFLHFGENTLDIPFAPSIPTTTEFALDVGGVFEVYPTRRVAFRFDVGDTIVRSGAWAFPSNNLQTPTASGFRFEAGGGARWVRPFWLG